MRRVRDTYMPSMGLNQHLNNRQAQATASLSSAQRTGPVKLSTVQRVKQFQQVIIAHAWRRVLHSDLHTPSYSLHQDVRAARRLGVVQTVVNQIAQHLRHPLKVPNHHQRLWIRPVTLQANTRQLRAQLKALHH